MSRNRTALALEQLPDKAQSLICSFASSPSCPAHVLLALVSKAWAAEAFRHFRLDGGSIELQLWCCTDIDLEERQREVERLEGLAGWLWQQGHLLNKLLITVVEPNEEVAEQYVLEAGQVVPSILAALAAAAKRPGGLRLQQLQVPAFPSTNLFTICRALSGCHQLRELHLSYSHSSQVTPADWTCLELLPTELQQLTLLTSLKLDGGLFDYWDIDFDHINLDNLFKCLPSSLVVFGLGDVRANSPNRNFSAHADTLQHLGALQKLGLPDVAISAASSSGEGEGNPLTQLTALTSLSCTCAMLARGEALLALPNLVELIAGQAELHHLEAVCSRTALQSFGLSLSPFKHEEQCASLVQLTQLTALRVVCMTEVEGDLLAPEDAEFEDWTRLGQAAGRTWAATVSALTGLRSLSAEPVLLELVNLAALTALTGLTVNLRHSFDWYPQYKLDAVLRGLVRGNLRTVSLQGTHFYSKDDCQAALADALSDDIGFTFLS